MHREAFKEAGQTSEVVTSAVGVQCRRGEGCEVWQFLSSIWSSVIEIGSTLRKYRFNFLEILTVLQIIGQCLGAYRIHQLFLLLKVPPFVALPRLHAPIGPAAYADCENQ